MGGVLSSQFYELVTIKPDAQGNEVTSFNFTRMIYQYTRYFARTDPEDALQYLYLLCLYGDRQGDIGKEQIRQCHMYIRELVLETRNYTSLLGSMAKDGPKTVGVFYL